MKPSQSRPKLFPIGPAAQYLSLSRDTLRRWEKKGKLKPFRTPTNRRLYTQKQLDRLLTTKPQSKTSPNRLTWQQHLAITIITAIIISLLVFAFTL
jgi:hypothetical protein